jgi:hypothetical protein
MIHTQIVLSTEAQFQLFSEAPSQLRVIKRLRISDNDDEDCELQDESSATSYRSLMAIDVDLSRDSGGRLLKIVTFSHSLTSLISGFLFYKEKKWHVQMVVSHRVYPLLFHPTWRHEITNSLVRVDKFGSYLVEMTGRHAGELCALIGGKFFVGLVEACNLDFIWL